MKCSEFVLCSSDLNTDTRPGNVRYPKKQASLGRAAGCLGLLGLNLHCFASSRQLQKRRGVYQLEKSL